MADAGTSAPPVSVFLAADQDWLARRIETEAWAYAKADHTMKDIRWGRVLGFLEVGTHAGYWSSKRAAQVADSIKQRWGLSRVRRRLTT